MSGKYFQNFTDVVYAWSLIIPVGFDSRLPPPPPPLPPLTVRVMLTLLQALLRRLLQLFLVECGVGMFRVLLRSLSRKVKVENFFLDIHDQAVLLPSLFLGYQVDPRLCEQCRLVEVEVISNNKN